MTKKTSADEKHHLTVVEPRRIVVKPTMSKSERFIGCPWPWGREVVAETDVGEPARFGSAVHELIERRLLGKPWPIRSVEARWSLPSASRANLQKRATEACDVLKAWLSGENPWRTKFRRLHVERSFALDLRSRMRQARFLKRGANEDHEYECEPWEFPGTADVIALDSGRLAVIDHKTGHIVGSPTENDQLLSLALTATYLWPESEWKNGIIVGILHAPGDCAPTLYADTIPEVDLLRHYEKLRVAHVNEGSGLLRPGPYCKWCQVFSECPTNAPALGEITKTRLDELTTPEAVGSAYERLKDFQRRFESLAGVVDAEIRSFVSKNGFALTPSGKTLEFHEESRDNLSKASIVRALGDVKGGREIERLRKLGAIEKTTRKVLKAT